MKYKVGDRVRFDSSFLSYVSEYKCFLENSNYIVTIKEVFTNNYKMEGFEGTWGEGNIVEKIEEVYTPIGSRWELLDIR